MQWILSLFDCDCSTLLLSIAAFLALVYFMKSKRPRNFPPGPSGLPIVGSAPFLGSNAAETLRKMKQKYGPVMSVQMGTEYWVVLNDYDTITEALVKQGSVFSGRPENFVFHAVSGGNGVATVDYGPVWKNLRKFGLTTLRGFGVGKKGMEQNVEEEMPYLIENLLSNEKKSVPMKLTLAVSNIICRVVFGSRFVYDDKNFLELIRILREFFSQSLDIKLIGLIVMAPALRHLPVFRGAFGRVMGDVKSWLEQMREIMEEHKNSFDDNDIRDFIDAFLKEMKERGDHDPSFCEAQLLQYIRDLFEAGTGTTSTTLSFALLCFANYPECQDRIAEEVGKVLGEDGIPTMKHRDEMPYTCAFIQELMRHRTLVPLSVFHKTNEEATLHGFTIPKNTTVCPNLWAVHMDPNLFENPEVFRPERFLDKDGMFVKSRHVIAFSVGPRHCIGEQLARMELFIFLTGIVQKIKVVPDPRHPPPSINDAVYSNMITLEPPEFTLKFEKR